MCACECEYVCVCVCVCDHLLYFRPLHLYTYWPNISLKTKIKMKIVRTRLIQLRCRGVLKNTCYKSFVLTSTLKTFKFQHANLTLCKYTMLI